MPLDTTETIELSAEALELGRQLGEAAAPDSEGGKRITKAEGRELLRVATALAAKLALDILD